MGLGRTKPVLNLSKGWMKMPGTCGNSKLKTYFLRSVNHGL